MSKAYHGVFPIFLMIIMNAPVSPASEPGAVAMDRKRFADAVHLQQEGLSTVHAQHDDKNESATLNNSGRNYALRGDYKSAVECYGKSAVLLGAAGDVDERGRVYRKLGLIYAGLGDHAKARDYFDLALGDHKINYDRQEMADDNAALGRSYAYSDDHRNALKYFQRSMSMSEAIGRTDYSVADDMIYLYLDQDYAEDAKKLIASKSLSLRPSAGRYYLYTNSYDEAKAVFRQCSDAAEKGRDVGTSIYCLTGLARSCEGLLSYDCAKSNYLKAFELAEREREGLAVEQRTGFYQVGEKGAWPRTESYEGLVRISQFNPGGVRKSFYYSELLRERIFYEAIARKYRGKSVTKVKAEVLAADEALTLQIADSLRQIHAAREEGNDTLLEKQKDGLLALKQKQAELVRSMRRSSPGYAALKYPGPIEPKAIPLSASEVIVEYEVMEPYVLAYVVRNGEIALSIFIDINRKQLTELIRNYRSTFDAMEKTSQLSKFSPQPGKQLYDLLLKPLLEARGQDGNKIISKSAKIIIMPDEILGLLPFEALIASYPENMQFKHGRFGPVPVGITYVGDDYDIGYSYSAAALAMQRSAKYKKGNGREGLLVLADPLFSDAAIRLKGTPVDKKDPPAFDANRTRAIITYTGSGGTRDAGDSLSFPRLAGTGLLAKSLAKTFSGKHMDTLLGPSASKKELLSKDLSRYKYLVFATHGILDTNVPYLREPVLVLSQADNLQFEDGILTMSDVLSLHLNAEVVALTACQAGRGRNAGAEGVAVLARAFQYAGAKSVLVSLWNGTDEASNLLVDKFFQYLKQGRTARQSLRLAREQVRQAGYDHPYYSASFILYGE